MLLERALRECLHDAEAAGGDDEKEREQQQDIAQPLPSSASASVVGLLKEVKSPELQKALELAACAAVCDRALDCLSGGAASSHSNSKCVVAVKTTEARAQDILGFSQLLAALPRLPVTSTVADKARDAALMVLYRLPDLSGFVCDMIRQYAQSLVSFSLCFFFVFWGLILRGLQSYRGRRKKVQF
jgi:hypothetical protein